MNGKIDLLVQIGLDGLAAGAAYSLVAVGYSLIFGVLRFINFAHAASIAVGAYAYLTFTAYLRLPLLLASVLTVIVAGFFGWVLEKVAYCPLRGSSPLAPLLSGIAIAILIENLLALGFGPTPYRLTQSSGVRAVQIFQRYSILPIHLYMLLFAVVSGVLIQVGLRFTRIGREIRATAENQELAKVRGVDTERAIATVFVFSSALAAITGIFIGHETQVYPQIGVLPSLKGFIAALVGGLGNTGGAMIAGVLLGLIEHISIWQLPTVYKDAVAFVLLLVFLLLKPGGLFPNRWTRI